MKLAASRLPSSPPDLRTRASWVDTAGNDGRDWEIPRGVSTTYLTHGLYRYVGKLPPPLTALLVDRYSSEGDVILDPMCGGGTTAIEAVSSNRDCISFDINPVSLTVTEAMSTVPDRSLMEFATKVLARAKPAQTPAELAKYFSSDSYGLLSEGVQSATSAWERALILSIARGVSFANTKKINTVFDPAKAPKDASSALLAAAAKFDIAFESFSRTEPRSSVVGEAAGEALPLAESSVDLVLLHPPYLTNTAFSEVTHLQLLLLGYSPTAIRAKELANRGSYFQHPNGLKRYLLGWFRTMQEASRVVRPGGHIAIVNGDGRIDGVRIPVGAITKEFGADLGLHLVSTARHVLNNHTGLTLTRRMHHQHVVVFQR